MHAAEDFFTLVWEAHIVSATMTHCKLAKANDPLVIDQEVTTEVTLVDLKQIVHDIVDEYVMHFIHTKDITDTLVEKATRPARSTRNRSASRKTKSSQKTRSTDKTSSAVQQADKVMNYGCHVIGLGLMVENFHDAWKEGDGGRLLRCWKFFLMHFRNDGRTKYALEAFKLLALTSALLTPRKAHQLTWNRTCNTNGGKGNNIPLDLKNEYLNAVFKDDINTFRANITEHSVQRSSRSVKRVSDALKKFDEATHVRSDSGRHVVPDTSEDFQLVLGVLQEEKIFTHQLGRQHSTFRNVNCDPFVNVKNKLAALHKWLKHHREGASIEQSLSQKHF